MKAVRVRGRGRGRPVTAALLAFALAGCAGPQNMLLPQGPAAARIADLWWLMFWVTTAICVLVALLLIGAMVQASRRARGVEVAAIPGAALVWGGGVLLPVVVLAVFLTTSLRVGAELREADRADAALTVEVIGHQYWWEIRYPEYGIATANEIRMPAGRRVRFEVHAPDVIHSFWVPQLQGKIDMLPGRVNAITMVADKPGLFRGQCAEYCGEAHALMAFWVLAMEPSDFDAWAQRRAGPLPEPDDEEVLRGREVFFAAGCARCHATRGAPLQPVIGAPGPDLTDFGGRLTIAAGTVPNNRGALAGWILDPDQVKPGSRMPPTLLDPPALHALLVYLESLR
jgi:cytochrome c oxidase subunit II